MKYPVYIPELTKSEKENLIDCIDSTWISSKGKYLDLFESKVQDYTGATYATTAFNGTVALHLALLALDLGANDEIIVPDFTYIASANVVKYIGAKIVLTDVDSKSWNIGLQNIRDVITPNTKAVIVTDIYGTPPSEMDAIYKYCKDNGIYLISDAAESLGASYHDRMAGNLADISIFSFFGNKTITTGEGGMVLTNNAKWIEKIKQLKNQGNSNTVRYYHDILGYNFRMTNMQAAIGCAQMDRIDDILTRKERIYNWYHDRLQNLVTFQEVKEGIKSSNWMISVLLNPNVDRQNLMLALEQEGIETRPFFLPVHSMPYFNTKPNTPITQDISMRGLNLPSYPMLTEQDIETITTQIIKNIHT